MQELLVFTSEEKKELFRLVKELWKNAEGKLTGSDYRFVKQRINQAVEQGKLIRYKMGFNPIIIELKTAMLVSQEIGYQRDIIISILINRCIQAGTATMEEMKEEFGENAVKILENFAQIGKIYAKSPTIETENFRKLLLSFTNDMRVILIMIANRLVMLRSLFDSTDDGARRMVANEASKLYIPASLSHGGTSG